MNRDYPGILSACHVNWFMDWPLEALHGELAKYVENHDLLVGIHSQIKLVNVLYLVA